MSVLRRLISRSLPWGMRRHVPSRIFMHLYSNGVFNARHNGKIICKLVSNSHQVENEIYWLGLEGCHEKKSLAIFMKYIEIFKPKVVYDIGANTGTYGIIAKAINPESKVYFFEPLTAAMSIVRNNLAVNNFQGHCFELALTNYNGTGDIYIDKGKDFAYSVTVNENLQPPGVAVDKLQIKVSRLDTLAEELNLEPPNLIKLDVETHEPQVLEGFGELLNTSMVFLIEVLNDDLGLKLQKFFPSDKFDYWNINDQLGTVRKTESIVKSDFYNYFICSPVQSKVLEETLSK